METRSRGTGATVGSAEDMLACESALVSSTAAAQPGHAGALSDAGTPRGMQIALQLQPFSVLPSGHHESVCSGEKLYLQRKRERRSTQ